LEPPFSLNATCPFSDRRNPATKVGPTISFSSFPTFPRPYPARLLRLDLTHAQPLPPGRSPPLAAASRPLAAAPAPATHELRPERPATRRRAPATPAVVPQRCSGSENSSRCNALRRAPKLHQGARRRSPPFAALLSGRDCQARPDRRPHHPPAEEILAPQVHAEIRRCVAPASPARGHFASSGTVGASSTTAARTLAGLIAPSSAPTSPPLSPLLFSGGRGRERRWPLRSAGAPRLALLPVEVDLLA
jgi:hypothetical protein